MTHLTPWMPAPAFTLPNHEGTSVSLASLLWKKIVLYFYPKDDTPWCTAQACNLRDNIEILTQKGYVVVWISPDGAKKHQKFITKYDLPFTLLSDENHEVALTYGVRWRKKFMGREYDGIFRTTFLIDEQGMIQKIISDVNTKEHTSQII